MTFDEIDTDTLQYPRNEQVHDFIDSHMSHCRTAREQVAAVCYHFRDTDTPLSLRDMSLVFGLCKSRIHAMLQQWDKYQGRSGPAGRPPLLSDGEWQELETFVLDRYESGDAPTVIDITTYLDESLGFALSPDSVGAMIRNSGRFRTVLGQRTDSARVHCDPSAIDSWFQRLQEVAAVGIPSSFVTNVDEIGFDGNELERDVYCIVPLSHVGQKVMISNEFRANRATMICGVACDGSALKPLMVVSRQTLDIELRKLGYTDDKILFAQSQTGFITKRIFLRFS